MASSDVRSRLPARTCEEYAVGWICALSIEMAAACAMLDNLHESLPKELNDTNEYEYGNIGPHNVVVACLGSYGTNNAAHVAANMTRSFPSLRVRLMVGIGGGVPNVDLRLGDVVVGQKIIQYDLGKIVQGGGFFRTATGSELHPDLSTAITKMRAIHEMKSNAISKIIHESIEAHPKMDEYAFPTRFPDRLFVSHYRHETSLPDCGSCDLGMLRGRPERKNRDPVIHYGSIASGNSVLKDGIKRDDLAADLDAICFEMEAAGLMNHFPCLVIRGICDYCDSHKNKAWQRYAAATAAAFAKELLLVMNANQKVELPQLAATRAISKFVVPYASNREFVGREEVLKQLQNRLDFSDHNRTWQPRVAIYGLGGIGKTQIAVEFAYWLQNTYPDISVYWVHASSVDRIRQSFTLIAQECKIPGLEDPKADLFSLMRDWLNQKEHGRWLVVIDNADDAELFSAPRQLSTSFSSRRGEGNLGSYIPACAHGGLLVTTRNKQAGSRLAKGSQLIEISKMEHSECDSLLRSQLEDTFASSENIHKLCEQLEFLPLALAQAAAFMREQSMTVGEYLELLDERIIDLLEEDFQTVGRDEESPHAVAATWMISYQQIQQQNPLATELLSLMSMFDRQDIPNDFLSNYYKRRNNGANGSFEIRKALGLLSGFCLIRQQRGGSYDMHRLVQLVTYKWLSDRGHRNRFEGEALLTISEVFPVGGVFENFETCSIYLAHAQAVRNFVSELAGNEVARATLLDNLGTYFKERGRLKDAEQALKDSKTIRERVLGNAHPDTMASSSHLASAFLEHGRLDEAEQLETETLKLKARILGREHPQTLNSSTTLAEIFLKQARFDKAEKLEAKTLELKTRIFGEEHPETLSHMNNLAAIFMEQGQFDEAEKMILKTLELTKTVRGEEHPKTLISTHNLATIYALQERFDEAETLWTQALKLTREIHGEEHPKTLSIMTSVAVIFCRQGRFHDAEKLGTKALELQERVLGENHFDTINSMNVLVSCLQEQRRFGEAEKLGIQALELSRKTHGGKHVRTLHAMSCLANIFWEQGRFEEFEKLVTEVFELSDNVLGKKHPHTLTAMYNLALAFYQQDRNDDARRLMEECIELRKVVLGGRALSHKGITGSVGLVE